MTQGSTTQARTIKFYRWPNECPVHHSTQIYSIQRRASSHHETLVMGLSSSVLFRALVCAMTMMNKKEDMNYPPLYLPLFFLFFLYYTGYITTTTRLKKIPCHHGGRYPISSPVTSRTLRFEKESQGIYGRRRKRVCCLLFLFVSMYSFRFLILFFFVRCQIVWCSTPSTGFPFLQCNCRLSPIFWIKEAAQ